MPAFFRALVRSVAITAWVLILLLPVAITQALRLHGMQERLLIWFYYGVGAICGLKRQAEGEISAARPLLMVSNHTSYFDVIVLGGLTPLRFTPKSDVRRWPLLGWLCSLGHVVYINRRPTRTRENQDALHTALEKGSRICLFPEGTTDNGLSLLPFRSSLLSLAEYEYRGGKLRVQPVTIAYTHIGSEPIQAQDQDRISWTGDSTFLPHLWRLLGLPGIIARIRLHPVRILSEGSSRKDLTRALEEDIGKALAEMLTKKAPLKLSF